MVKQETSVRKKISGAKLTEQDDMNIAQMYYQHGTSVADIAYLTNISEAAVANHIECMNMVKMHDWDGILSQFRKGKRYPRNVLSFCSRYFKVQIPVDIYKALEEYYKAERIRKQKHNEAVNASVQPVTVKNTIIDASGLVHELLDSVLQQSSSVSEPISDAEISAPHALSQEMSDTVQLIQNAICHAQAFIDSMNDILQMLQSN